MNLQRPVCYLLIVCALVCPALLRAESQGNDYKGISDPFGDPANYEFAEDEKEDKEFFHLGRYLMFGVDMGMAVFTGGLGRTTTPGFYVGARLVYFFDKQLALEAGAYFSTHVDSTRTSSKALDIDTQMIPVTVGMRYYFDTKNAPKAIAVANPYLALGGGMYIRTQNVTANSGFSLPAGSEGSANSFGVQGGAGVEFNIYRKHIYLGADVRYHLIFFPDESDTFGGALADGDRAGDIFTTSLTLTYSF